MEGIATDVEGFHLGVADLDTFLVDPRTRLCRCGRDEVDPALR